MSIGSRLHAVHAVCTPRRNTSSRAYLGIGTAPRFLGTVLAGLDHIQTLVLDSCSPFQASQTLITQTARPAYCHDRGGCLAPPIPITKKTLSLPCPVPNGEVFSSHSLSSETPACPQIIDCGNLQEARRLADQSSANSEPLVSHGLLAQTGTHCPPAALCMMSALV